MDDNGYLEGVGVGIWRSYVSYVHTIRMYCNNTIQKYKHKYKYKYTIYFIQIQILTPFISRQQTYVTPTTSLYSSPPVLLESTEPENTPVKHSSYYAAQAPQTRKTL